MSHNIHMLIRSSHILVGFIGLFAFWVPVFAKKGGRLHIFFGRVFEYSSYYAAVSALVVIANYLLTPNHFAFIDRPEASAEELSRVQFAQFLLTILGFLAWSVLAQMRTGIRVVRMRGKSPDTYRSFEAKWWLYSLPAVAIAMIGYGAYRLSTGGSSVHWISVVVPLIALFDFPKERRFYLNPGEHKMSWWYKHMECMLGCGIAFHTAGFLFTTRWMEKNWGLQLPGVWQLAPWILPTVVGVPATHWWIKRYRMKFGDLASSDSSPTATPQLEMTD